MISLNDINYSFVGRITYPQQHTPRNSALQCDCSVKVCFWQVCSAAHAVTPEFVAPPGRSPRGIHSDSPGVRLDLAPRQCVAYLNGFTISRVLGERSAETLGFLQAFIERPTLFLRTADADVGFWCEINREKLWSFARSKWWEA